MSLNLSVSSLAADFNWNPIPKETLTTVSRLPHQLSLLMDGVFTSFPSLHFLTIIAQVAKTGKTVTHRRSFDRFREFFYRSHVEEVMVCRKEKVVFMKGKCWASQCRQVLHLFCPEDGGRRVQYATCRRCVAGTDFGLCSHMAAVLMVLDNCRKKPSTSVISLPRSLVATATKYRISRRVWWRNPHLKRRDR